MYLLGLRITNLKVAIQNNVYTPIFQLTAPANSHQSV